jgi:hypothetical protein
MRGDAMEVVTVGQVLTGRGSGVKDYSSKREDNGMPIGRTKMLPAMSTTARYVDQLEAFGLFSLKSSCFTLGTLGCMYARNGILPSNQRC